jgi:hypothetical protein
MSIDNLFGLPAHPLVVHAAVVLLPIAAIATVVVAVVPRWRRPYALLVFVMSIAAAGAIWLAKESGESLEERVTETALVERHAELAERSCRGRSRSSSPVSSWSSIGTGPGSRRSPVAPSRSP